MPQYGFTVDCTDEELNELIDTVRNSEVEAFHESYNKLLDAGKKLSTVDRNEMIKESKKQRGIIKTSSIDGAAHALDIGDHDKCLIYRKFF